MQIAENELKQLFCIGTVDDHRERGSLLAEVRLDLQADP